MKVWAEVHYKLADYVKKKSTLTGITIYFRNGNGESSSFFSSPCEDIKHAGERYLRERGYNIESEFQRKYFNKRYKEIVKAYRELQNS